MFCTLQLVWQAPPLPESAKGMGNTWAATEACQTAPPRYSLIYLCFAHKTYIMATFLAGDFPVPCVLMREPYIFARDIYFNTSTRRSRII